MFLLNLCFSPFAVRIPSHVIVSKFKGNSISEVPDNKAAQPRARRTHSFAQLPGMRAGRGLRQGEQWRVWGAHRGTCVPSDCRDLTPSPYPGGGDLESMQGPATPQGTGLLNLVPLRAPAQEEVSSGPQSSTWEVTWRGRGGNRVSPTGIGTCSMEASLPNRHCISQGPPEKQNHRTS